MGAKLATMTISQLEKKKQEIEEELSARTAELRKAVISDILDLIDNYGCGITFTAADYSDERSMEFSITNDAFAPIDAEDIYNAYDGRRRTSPRPDKK